MIISTGKEAGAEWAFKLLARGKSRTGLGMPLEVTRCATDAIRSGAGYRFMRDAPEDVREQYALMYDGIIAAEGQRDF
jgi:hypothetical protein